MGFISREFIFGILYFYSMGKYLAGMNSSISNIESFFFHISGEIIFMDEFWRFFI